MEERTDRAGRLGELLASRNALVRREAADALGHFPLTNKQLSTIIRDHLQAVVWETRVAAAEALRAVLRAMPTSSREVTPRVALLSSLDLFVVVRDYYPLLSCETELMSRMGECAFGEQRKLVDEELQLQSAFGISSLGFLTDEDFYSRPQDSSVEQKLNLVASTLSLEEDEMRDELDLAVHMLCSQLVRDLADPKWETRHGAGLALSLIISLASSRLSPEMVDLLSSRLFQTLALDSFIDFASGRCAVGPVREVIAECIASLIAVYPNREFLDAIVQQLSTLHSMNDAAWLQAGFDRCAEARKHLWFQRQAAVIVLKYHFASRCYCTRFEEFYKMICESFEDTHDEVSSSALSAVTALFCKDNLRKDVSELIAHVELVIYRFIESACNASRQQQLVDVDTVVVDLLTLLQIWMTGAEERRLPFTVLVSLSRLLNPLHVTRSLKIVSVFSTSFSRILSIEGNNGAAFDNCSMVVLSSLFRVVLFAAPQETESLIEACISSAYCIVAQFSLANRLPSPLVETIGRWSACLLLDAKNAEIDLAKYNVGEGSLCDGTQLMCGDEIRTLNDLQRIDALLTRKLHVARFLAPLISAVHSFPSMIGNQSLSDATQLLLNPLLNSPLLMHRLGGSLLTHSWFTYNWVSGKNDVPPLFLLGLLQRAVLTSDEFTYDDEKFFFSYLDTIYKEFTSYCMRKGVKQADLVKLNESGEDISSNASSLFKVCMAIVKVDERIAVEARYDSLMNSVATAKAILTANISRVNALHVSALLIMCPQVVLETPTLNPLIKPLLELLRYEENFTVARHILNSLPILFRMTSEKKPNPHSKMIKQIVINLTSCESRFPQEFGINRPVLLSQRPPTVRSARCSNAEVALRALVSPAAATDLNCLLDFRQMEAPKMVAMYMDAYRVYVDEIRKLKFSPPLFVKEMMVELKAFLNSEDAAVRLCSTRCAVEIARLDSLLAPVLHEIVIPLRDKLRDGEANVFLRCAIAELLFFFSELQLEIIGGLRVLAPMSLRLMTDNCETVREAAAVAFRNFVPLMALKAGKREDKGDKCVNDSADEGFANCAMDVLLGDPSQLPPLLIEDIVGLSPAVALRRYQQEGIRWMSFLEEYGLSGILADDMGLGKTLQALCLIAIKLRDKPSAKVLIVCPPTLVGHWCVEWAKYFPLLTPFHKVDEGMKEERNLAMKPGQSVTVASHNTIRASSYFQKIDWFYVILDEGHVIRNPMTQLFKAVTSLRSRNRLILSGTPVQNTPADLWALFQFLMPGYLGSMKQFKTSFLKAINACRSVSASAKEIEDGQSALERLHKAVLPFIMRRLKTDVLQDLPEKIVQDYVCCMTSSQRVLYEHIIDQCTAGQPAVVRADGLSALETITELRKCIVHPSLVSPKAAKSFNLEGVQRRVEESGKMIALRELLRECGIGSFEGYSTSEFSVQDSEADMNAHRALVFCQRLSTVQLIVELLESGQLGQNIRYSILDGTVPVRERHAVAENFNRDPGIDLLLLTTCVGGEGLNLTGADVVIFVEHDWNPVKDLQAMDRAHRIGQKRTVNVYRLITEASIEEKIMRNQKFKTDTANALVGADNRSLQTMATEQLVELFALEGGGGTSGCAPKSSSNAKVTGNANTFDSTQKWDLEELWDLSQYDRFNVVNIARDSVDDSSSNSPTLTTTETWKDLNCEKSTAEERTSAALEGCHTTDTCKVPMLKGTKRRGKAVRIYSDSEGPFDGFGLKLPRVDEQH